jgi:uncharacterized protein YPO0396
MTELNPVPQAELLDFAASDERAGFRLHHLELYNWGTFHDRVWRLAPGGDNTLLTGDIGSGKSTLVDAVTTLLVPPQKLAYNKAAGAEARERTLRSYVLGYYKAERSEAGLQARPVALRDANSYSVILGHFYNEGFDQHVTLGQVFWIRETQGQPARFYLVADVPLTIAEHFAGFGSDINDLRKRLRRAPNLQVFDTFPPYGAAFRRRLGIGNEQALELFSQTVSMKSVGNLTDFVREHMLEAFDVEQRIEALIHHFDDLNRAHGAVLKAKDQIERLAPLVADCQRHRELSDRVETLTACRDALRAWFAGLKAELLEKRLDKLDAERAKIHERIDGLSTAKGTYQGERDELKRAIAENGGDRLERIKAEISRRQTDKDTRIKRAERYDARARAVDLPRAANAETFFANRLAIEAEREATEVRQATVQNVHTETSVEFQQLRDQHAELSRELESLRVRRSNIPARMLTLREALCRAASVAEEALPFAGELIQVREDERAWEGAAERLLHNFGLSLLVPDTHYARVAEWVDRTHLGGRLVYYRVRRQRTGAESVPHPDSLVRKLAIKPDSDCYGWLEAELARRFDYACCDTLDRFRREVRAVTPAGQIKAGDGRHEKDDRHRIDDRSRYVLGWSNEAKIAVLEKQAKDLESRMQKLGSRIGELEAERRALQERLGKLYELAMFDSFQDLDWRSLVMEIERLEQERRQLESESDILRTLERQLGELEAVLAKTESALTANQQELARTEEKRKQARDQLAECEARLATASAQAREMYFPQLEAMRAEALGEHTLTVESCENREKDMRDWLQKRIDKERERIGRLGERIIKTMEAYGNAYPLETREVDVSIAAAGEYRRMLHALQSDDLPRFEARFKELLNENTIREVANFQSVLHRERQIIRERIEIINRSLNGIDYNPGRYIVLEAESSPDPEIRDFQQDLRACTEGALTGSDEEQYSEAKFLQVKRIIERFRGREGSTDLDRRWTRKVTDVRSWYLFSASERWREDGGEHEHYTDSGGKSGGQKEKLAYTVLAASLAYQFGLEWGATRSRSFRFVVIDEAFGRGSDESTRYGLELFRRLNLQLLIVTPLQKIHVIEPHVAAVGFVHSEEGRHSMLRNLTIEDYRAERAARIG